MARRKRLPQPSGGSKSLPAIFATTSTHIHTNRRTMKLTRTPLTLAAFAAATCIGAMSALALDLVYEDNFDGDTYAVNTGTGGGLEYQGGLYRDWAEDAGGIYFLSGGNGGTHSNLSTINNFDVSAGFRLEVTYTHTANLNNACRLVMGVMDAANPKAAGLLGENPASYYGIGFAHYSNNQLNGLTFANGTTTSEIDQSQSRTNGTHTLVLEMDDSSNWSYSIDGAIPTTGTIGGTGFDYTRDYCFVTKAQKTEARVSAVKLYATASAPDPKITSISVSGNTATLKMEGTDGTDYWCASSTDLTGFTTEESTSLGSPFQTSSGVATFTVDVTGDSELFLRVQDADPVP